MAMMKSSSITSHSNSSSNDYYYKSRRKHVYRKPFLENQSWLRKHNLIDGGDDNEETSYKNKFGKRERKKIEKLKLAHDLITSGDIDELNLSHLLKSNDDNFSYKSKSYEDGNDDDKEDDLNGKKYRTTINEIQILCHDLLDMKNSELNFENCHLTTLNLSRCRMGKEEVTALAKCFQSSSSEHSIVTTKLRTLNLSHNQLNDTGIKLLAESMSSGEASNSAASVAKPIPIPRIQLQELILKDNNIGVVGAQALSTHILPHFSRLTKLDLQDNHISDEGLIAFSNSLLESASPSSLRILH